MQHQPSTETAIGLCTLVLFFWLAITSAFAAGYEKLKQNRPELFHPETGFRIAKQRSPTPDNVPAPVRKIDTEQARDLIFNGAVAIDVFGAIQSRYDELDGTWLVSKTHLSLPGAIWLPEVGRGTLTDDMQRFLASNMLKVTKNNKEIAIVVFCVADCWMSWNASQRISKLGYSSVYWYRHGTDGWQDKGFPLEPAEPVPVVVE